MIESLAEDGGLSFLGLAGDMRTLSPCAQDVEAHLCILTDGGQHRSRYVRLFDERLSQRVAAVEMVSLPSYAIAGYKPGDRRAAEASLKYVIYGGVASGIMLFGLSYIYGLTGSTNLTALGVRLDNLAMPASAGGQAGLRAAVMVAVIFVLCGIGYKIAAVPWHMWCPDVYEGAPTPFTAFLSVGPKATVREYLLAKGVKGLLPRQQLFKVDHQKRVRAAGRAIVQTAVVASYEQL